jgi:hypothetical protein
MKFDLARLQASTSIFGPDGQHRYWWRHEFTHGAVGGDRMERVLWVFLCPSEGPTTPRHLSDMRAMAAGLSCRNFGVVSLFNSMAPKGDLMRQDDPVGPHADAALKAALDWVRNRPAKVLPCGRVMLATGTPPWTNPGHVELVNERNRFLWDQLRKRQMRPSRLGSPGQPRDAWAHNPLEPTVKVFVQGDLQLAHPNDGGPMPDLEPGPIADFRKR